MINELFFSPPVLFLFYFLISVLVYGLISRVSAKVMDHPEKYLPYSSGQNLAPGDDLMTYQAFFRIGLLFVVLHVAVLVISTLPFEEVSNRMGFFYLFGVLVSAFVLADKYL